MNFRNITQHIKYVGVNDRTSHKFENLWPLPFGVSYNSYLVEGNEKVALIDTVELASMIHYVNNLKEVLGNRNIDYLIVNHMEPDHSGGIPIILNLFPDLKIVGNKQTFNMLKGFYAIEDNKFIEIKENDEISLGDVTLKFIMTPMVHWPETMMTFVKEEKILFSGDGFGCFGALNGGVVDFEMDTEIYIPEMYRYYSNIVGKYGKPVQMALKKTAALDIEFIASTHGPVWKERVKEVLDIYNRLSLYEGENGVTIVYGSMYGNTAEITEIIANRLCEQGVKKIKIHNVCKSEMSYIISDAFRYKGLIIGCPTYNGSLFPPIATFLTAMENREIKNKVVATFGSFTWASAACKQMNECFARLKLDPISTMDMRQSPDKDDITTGMTLADRVASALGYNGIR